MADPVDILVDNLTETYRRIERMLIIGLGASVWLLLTSIENPALAANRPVPKIDLPLGLGENVFPAGLALIALSGYFVCGALAVFHFQALERSLKLLREKNPELCEAVGAFPSLATLSPLPRTLALLALAGIGIVALILFSRRPNEPWRGVWAGVIISGPYLIMFAMAFRDGARQALAKRVAERAAPDSIRHREPD
jgi:hypothetical protein